jgi:putative DNA primase/helicase
MNSATAVLTAATENFSAHRRAQDDTSVEAINDERIEILKDEPEESPPLSDAEVNAEIDRLAKLNSIQYEHERKSAAERLGLRATILDQMVKARCSPEADGKKGQGRKFAPPEPMAWPEPVDGENLLTETAAAIREYVVMPDEQVDTAALWAAHTYLLDILQITPRLGITSPEKGCGKTTLLDVLGCLVFRPISTANVTTAAVFRIIAKAPPTLLIDEADTFLTDKDELRGILNSGHRRGGLVIRTVGDDHDPEGFPTFCPCAIAMIGKLPDTLADRSVAVRLRRRLPGEAVNRFRADRTQHLNTLAQKLARWAADNSALIRDADPKVPEGITNRAEDNWRPLLAIASVAGGAWPARARDACMGNVAKAEDQSIGVALLTDIKAIFERDKLDEITSKLLVAALTADEDSRWREYKAGKPITQRQLATRLGNYGVTSETVHPRGEKDAKGYKRARFQEAWECYL